MLHITTKLKRVRYLRWFFQIIILVIFFPLIALQWIGNIIVKSSDWLSDWITDTYRAFERYLCKKYKWNEIARAQYERYPEKFNDQQKRKRSKNIPIKR